jgi:hypothetical protein
MHRTLPVLALALLSGCGYEGQPLPPLANVPGRVTGLTAIQQGSQLVIQFTPPQLTTEGFPIKAPVDLDVRVGSGGEPFDEAAWEAGAEKLARVSEGKGASEFTMPVAKWVGKELIVGVRAVGSNGKQLGWMFLTVPIVAPPQPPTGLRAENTAAGVRLSWNSSGNPVRVYRKTGAVDFAPVADASQTPWTDSTTQFGQEYDYKLQTLVKLPGDHQAESELSPELRITPEDKFPPAIPSGLQVTSAPASVELSWNGNTEPDLAGYRVYRSTAGGPFERVAEVQLPAWSDMSVDPGKQYRYTVTTVDRSGNESPQSEAVELHRE